MLIREAVSEDVAAILEVYRASGVEGDRGFSGNEGWDHFAVFAAYPNYACYVAVQGGAVVGCYSLLVMDNLAKRGARSGIVEDVGVLPECQGLGVGRAMMHHAMEQCRAAGCYKLTLSSNLRRVEAHAFYEAVGFERHGYSFVVPIA